MPTFLPEDSLRTPRFVGITTFMRLPHTRELEGVDVAVLGIPFDTGSPFRVGCRFGPSAVRAMSLMLRPINPYQDLNVFEECAIVDYGDADVVPGYLPESFERIEAAMAPLVARQVIPVGIGGDHSIALPELRALGRHHGPGGPPLRFPHRYLGHVLRRPAPQRRHRVPRGRGRHRRHRLDADRDAGVAVQQAGHPAVAGPGLRGRHHGPDARRRPGRARAPDPRQVPGSQGLLLRPRRRRPRLHARRPDLRGGRPSAREVLRLIRSLRDSTWPAPTSR